MFMGTRFSLISGSSGPCLGARFANYVVPYGVFRLTVPTRVAGIRSITVQNTVSGGVSQYSGNKRAVLVWRNLDLARVQISRVLDLR
jgi:hypothetical protein